MKINKISLVALGTFAFSSFSQTTLNRPITTAIPFININPDPRAGGMGDAGVATSSTTNDMYWNMGKLAFNEKDMGVALSVNPWLRNIVSDMFLNNLSGYYKRKKEEAFGMNLTYFDMGKIEFKDAQNNSQGTYNPREFALSGGYSRKLSEKFGVGLALKYIHSSLTGGYSGTDARPLNTAAVDIGAFYTMPIQVKTSQDKLSFGASINNIGSKVKYVNSTSNTKKDFIPTNFRLGSAFTHEIDVHNKVTFALDLNKLMVPSPKSVYDDSAKTYVTVYPDKGLFSGMFGSFGDAQGGMKEEWQEVAKSLGVEYNYNDIFMARLGYFHENAAKGARKYITLGFGLKYNALGFDFAYLVAQGKNNALGETLRFLISYNVNKKLDAASDTIQED